MFRSGETYYLHMQGILNEMQKFSDQLKKKKKTR